MRLRGPFDVSGKTDRLGGAWAMGVPKRGGGGVAPLTYTLFHGFEATAGTPSAAITQGLHSGSRKVQGTNGVQITGIGTNASQSLTTVKTFTDDMAAWDYLAMCIDLGEGYENTIGDLRLRFTSSAVNYDYRANTGAGVSLSFPYKTETRGKVWVAFKVSDFKQTDFAGTSVTTLGTASKVFTLSPINANANGATDIVLDAAVLPASTHKPIVCLTFDDSVATQYTNAFPALQARGLVGTLYVNSGLIGTGGYLTWAQVKEMYEAGWALCLNSERTDQPITAPATRAAAITALETVRSDIITGMSGVGVDVSAHAGLDHLAYSYGTVGYPTGNIVQSCNPNGTTTLSVSNAYGNGICAGMRVTGTGVPADCYVVRCISNTSIETSAAITTGTGVSLTFTARISGRTRTNASPSTTLTVSSVASLFVGMHVFGYNIPADTKITAIAGSDITVSNTVPAGTAVLCNFGYVDGEFWPSKVQDALTTAGFKSGRRTGASGYGGLFTGFGLDPLMAKGLPGIGLTDPPSAAETARMSTWIGEHTDIITYSHNVTNTAGFDTFLDQIVTWRDAGLIEVRTIPDWYSTVTARTFV